MEIWSLTRFPEGERAGDARRRPSCGSATIRGGRRSPRRTSRTCPRQQKGLHAKGFEYMRLSERARGPHLELRADHRRLPRRPPLRAAAPRAAGGQRVPARAADRRPRLLSMSADDDVRRRRRRRPRHHRRVHPRARRRPHRRRRRHLLPRRRRATSRAWAPTRATTRSARPTPKWKPRRPQRHLVAQHARHRLERPRGHARSATWSSSCRATPAGRSSSSAATTTRSTTTTARGASTAARPSS